MIFVNLPVNDLATSTNFHELIGCEKNAQLSNEQAAKPGLIASPSWLVAK